MKPTAQRPGQANGSAGRQQAQINRILITSLSPNGLSNDDRTYLAQLVAAQTGVSQDEAQQRVDTVTTQMKQDATQAAETARKAAAYVSFWTFMSLLFGAVCATLGGILGGDCVTSTSPGRRLRRRRPVSSGNSGLCGRPARSTPRLFYFPSEHMKRHMRKGIPNTAPL